MGVILMRDDVAVLISRAERRGAAFRVREGQVEVCGLDRLPEELIDELQGQKAKVLRHLSHSERLATSKGHAHLFSWATELAEMDMVLFDPVRYTEAPERIVTTRQASWYAAHYLNLISDSRIQLTRRDCWTPEYWRDRQEEAMGALEALRGAM